MFAGKSEEMLYADVRQSTLQTIITTVSILMRGVAYFQWNLPERNSHIYTYLHLTHDLFSIA